jgi:hypothetical protein
VDVGRADSLYDQLELFAVRATGDDAGSGSGAGATLLSKTKSLKASGIAAHLR